MLLANSPNRAGWAENAGIGSIAKQHKGHQHRAVPPLRPDRRTVLRIPTNSPAASTTPRVLTRSRSAAPVAAVPFLPASQSRTRRDDPIRSAHGRDVAPRWGRSGATMSAAPRGGLGPRALRAEVLSRDDPRAPAPPRAVVEEGQEVAGPGRSGAATSVHRAAPRWSGRCPTRSASRGLPG